MKKIRQSIITLLIVLFTVSAFVPAYADSSSGGGGGGVSVSVANASMSEFVARGTITLPDGFVAPNGGMDIYGGFGGVELGGISLSSAADADDVCESNEDVKYENTEIIATIPQGKNSVDYEKTFKIRSSFDGFYGEFWIYDTNIVSQDGTQYLSNCMVVSNLTKIKANKKEYTNVNAALCAAKNTIDYCISFEEILKSESPNQSIYIIADDGYDKYITRHDFDRCDENISGILRTDDTECKLKYYIPSSTKLKNQRVGCGTYTVGNADFETVNNVLVLPATCISGKVSRPDDDDSFDELKVRVSTSEADVDVIIPKGEKSTEYIAAYDYSRRTDISAEVLNSDFYGYSYVYAEDISDRADILLKRMCVISGKIKLPEGISMADKTYFNIFVEIQNEDRTYSDSNRLIKYSDEDCEYKFSVPYEYRNDKFFIAYHYGSYESIPDFPKNAANPLRSYKGNNNPGGSGGGGSSVAISSGYEFEEPTGLCMDKLIYINTEYGTVNKNEALRYGFDGDKTTADITLAKETQVKDWFAVGGYFIDLLSHNTGDVRIRLLDADTKLPKYEQIPDSGKYIFYDIDKGKYIIEAQYEEKSYYYTGTRLSKTIDSAKIIDTDTNSVSYGNDMYYDNIFPTQNLCTVKRCVIDGENMPANIGIYDIYGNLRCSYNGYGHFTIPFSPFVMSINGAFVSEFENYKYFDVTGLTNEFGKARRIESVYRDALCRYSGYDGYNIINVNANMMSYSIEYAMLDENNYVCTDIIKKDDNLDDCTIYYAVYTDGKLSDLISDKLELEGNAGIVKSSRAVTLSNAADSVVKVFLWGNKINPMSKGIIVR